MSEDPDSVAVETHMSAGREPVVNLCPYHQQKTTRHVTPAQNHGSRTDNILGRERFSSRIGENGRKDLLQTGKALRGHPVAEINMEALSTGEGKAFHFSVSFSQKTWTHQTKSLLVLPFTW